MTKIYDPKGVQAFRYFNIHLGGKHMMWHFRPTVRTDKTVSRKALSQAQLKAKRNEEQERRVALLASAYARIEDKSEEELDQHAGICSMVPPPLWLNGPNDKR